MTFTVECAFRLTPSGVEFRLDDEAPENEICKLRGEFVINEVYAPEADVGVGITWDARLETIEIRAIGSDWRPLDWSDFKTARVFLDAHCREVLDRAERETALEVYYGD
jgi:hypothetical protein